MKNIILSAFLLVFFAIAFASCQKDCYLCTTSGDETTICKADFASTKDYTEALKKIKALGFTCK